jgi:methylenetetrahydrofolate reductase (NADPH)
VNVASIHRGAAGDQVARLMRDFSLEITSSDGGRLSAARQDLPPGTCVSITFLPGDDVGALAETAMRVREMGFVPVPHISARRIRSPQELGAFLSALRARASVDRAFVVAGDPASPLGPYADALALIRTGMLADSGVRTVGIAGYPEGHASIDGSALWRALREKKAALASAGQDVEIVTQFAFDAAAVADWVGRVRDAGFGDAIRIGVPGPTSVQSLVKFAARCGVGASTRILSKYGISITRLLSTATPDRFLHDLASRLSQEGGAVRVHVYPFGGIEKAVGWAVRTGEGENVR